VALHTHRALAQLIRDRGGDYLLLVKESQPQLQQSLLWYFEDRLPTDRWASTREPHRGRIKPRTISVTSELTAYLADWPPIRVKRSPYSSHRWRLPDNSRTLLPYFRHVHSGNGSAILREGERARPGVVKDRGRSTRIHQALR
jgi:hypothetical protein